MKPLICPICLRTDRKLKTIATVLSEYHDELTEYCLEINNPKYCADCEHLLKKTYNFTQKCLAAAKILNKWKSTKMKRLPANQLFLNLPPISLDMWTPENSKVYTYVWSHDLETPSQLDVNIFDGPDVDIVKEEINENMVHSEKIFKLEILCDDNQITGVSETFIQSFNKESADTMNVFQNKLVNDNTVLNARNSGTLERISSNNSRSDKTNDITKQETNTISSSTKVRTKNRQFYIELVSDIDDDKKDRNSKNDSVNDRQKSTCVMPKLTNHLSEKVSNMTNVTNDVPKLTHDVAKLTDVMRSTHTPIVINEPNSINDMPKAIYNMPILVDDGPELTNDITKSTHNMPKVLDHVSKVINPISNSASNSNNINANVNKPEDMDVELICLDDDDDDIIVIDDEIDYPDNASLNSDDDCDDYLHTPPRNPKKKNKKMTLTELAEIALSDDDFDDDYLSVQTKKPKKTTKKDYSIESLISNEKSITAKLAAISESLDSICKNWEVTSLTDLSTQLPKDEVNKFLRQYLTDTKVSNTQSAKSSHFKKTGVCVKLTHISNDLDLINDRCVEIVEEYKKGLYNPKQRLIQKFQSWGELKTDDGIVFDKDIIINCLAMVSERMIRQLLDYLQEGASRAKCLSPRAARILQRIQNKQHENQYESVFDIEYMATEKEMLEEFERRKTYQSYVEAAFKCQVCYQGFKHERLLEYHKKSHDDIAGSISCSICRTRHRSRRKLKKHMVAHEAVYKCKLCPLVTYYKLSMRNHYEQHKGTVYKCESCGTTYKSKSVYLYHQTKVHPRGSHVCTSCGRGFVSALGLRNHKSKKHRGEAPSTAGVALRCEPCELTFPSQEAYHRHQRSSHGAPPLPSNKNRRAAILLTPRKKPMMTCRVCNTVGNSYGWLNLHFSMEHPSLDIAAVYADKRTYLCDICGKGFSNKYSLQEHIGFHDGITFPCPSCSKRFPSRAAVKRHLLTHAPPRFCCELCGKKFHAQPNLYNHMRIHIGDRRYKCNICDKGFLYRFSLREHIRGVHNHERRVRKRGADLRAETHGVNETGLGVTDMGAKGVIETGAGEMAVNQG